MNFVLVHGGWHTGSGWDAVIKVLNELGRVDNAWRNRDIVNHHCPNPPSSYVDRFHTDSIVFEPNALEFLIETMGIDRVLFGSDHPFPLGEQTPGSMINNHPNLSIAQKDSLLEKNARRFFNLDSI